jgi:hypothetical protein
MTWPQTARVAPRDRLARSAAGLKHLMQPSSIAHTLVTVGKSLLGQAP